jgi:hypothetical protein
MSATYGAGKRRWRGGGKKDGKEGGNGRTYAAAGAATATRARAAGAARAVLAGRHRSGREVVVVVCGVLSWDGRSVVVMGVDAGLW